MAMAMVVAVVMLTMVAMVVFRTGGRVHANITWVKEVLSGRGRGEHGTRLIQVS